MFQKRSALAAVAALVAVWMVPDTALDAQSDLEARARAIHERVITLDTHDDINPSNFTAERNYTQDLDTQVNLPKMFKGGLDASFFIVYVGQGPLTPEGYANAYKQAIDKFDAIHRLTKEIAPDKIELAVRAADVPRIAAKGKKVALIGVENAYPIGTDLGRIKEFYDRGARYMSLAHNGHSQFSDSNTGEREGWMHNGLSELGRKAIAEMNRLGIMVDVSHPSKQSMMQTAARSKAPIIASHSSARALSNVPRNIPDDLLKRIAKNGGVVCVNFYSVFVDTQTVSPQSAERDRRLKAQQDAINEKYKNDPERRAEESDKLEAANPLPPLPISKLIDHIDHIVKVAGIDHVGIGADFDGANDMPEGAQDVSMLPNITYELLKRGYTERDIRKILGENFLRAFAEAERVARGMSRSISGDGSLRRINK
jgi:microsomal dipeptidase-like Zn-dependent dipeptidase